MGEKIELLDGLNQMRRLGKRIIVGVVGAVSVLLLSGCQRVEITRGYLSKGPPVALRFAEPEPDVVDLPPLPKSSNPQPGAMAEMPGAVFEPPGEGDSRSTSQRSRAEYWVR